MTEQLFESAASALTFAYQFSSLERPISAMGQMLKGEDIGSGKGLGGLDGAGQSAFIQSAVDRLPLVERACIIARYAAKFEPCECGRECCTGEKTTRPYRNAITDVVNWSFAAAPASIDRATRAAVVRAYFDRGISLAGEFERRKVPRATGYDAKRRIWDALKTVETDAQNRATKELSWLFAPTEIA